ncbi:MAG: ABC transporter substrate-binding protein, partial [Bradyrhizobium sp.]|nr:ABC transporter substrate-binding protein [Bradyrhizobium sp.]
MAVAALATFMASSAFAAPGDNVALVRQLGTRVGPVIGAALACRDIARPRIQSIIEKFQTVIREAAAS